MGRAKHCSAEKRQLIIKLKQKGKTYKFIQETQHVCKEAT